jgi:hypothetical protein
MFINQVSVRNIMTRKKKKNASDCQKIRRTQQMKTKSRSKTLGSLRQLGYKKAFRIAPAVWYEEFLKDIEKETETAPKIETKPSQKTELKELLLLVAELATGLWRIDKKTVYDDTDVTQDSMRSVRRHVESTLDVLASGKVEIRDHTGEKYVTGMALKVIAFQPTVSIRVERIAETIKPSVFYKNQLIQRGEVIVEKPEVKQAELKSEADMVEQMDLTDEKEEKGQN